MFVCYSFKFALFHNLNIVKTDLNNNLFYLPVRVFKMDIELQFTTHYRVLGEHMLDRHPKCVNVKTIGMSYFKSTVTTKCLYGLDGRYYKLEK